MLLFVRNAAPVIPSPARPPLEKAGVLFTDQGSRSISEEHENGTCLNPPHWHWPCAAAAFWACSPDFVEIRSPQLKGPLKNGYDEACLSTGQIRRPLISAFIGDELLGALHLVNVPDTAWHCYRYVTESGCPWHPPNAKPGIKARRPEIYYTQYLAGFSNFRYLH